MSTPEKETLPCPNCDGTKVIEVYASIDPAARLIEECCPACHGTGYQKNNLQPDFMGAPKRKLDQLLADGFRVTGFAIERHAEGAEPVRGFINMGGLVGWWTPGIQAPAKTEEAWAELRAQVDVSNAALFQAQEASKALTAQMEALTKDLADANETAAWHKRRTSLLQGLQSTMQEPERTIVCDVLANGYLLQGPDGLPDKQRYAPQALTRPAVPDHIIEAQAAVAPNLRVYNLIADRRRAAIVHPDDAAVDRFAAAMKEKLALSRAKGRNGWQTCPPEDLSRMLCEHVKKGDPRDVANFCMMLWSLGAGIASPTIPTFGGYDPKFCPGSNPDNPQPWPDDEDAPQVEASTGAVSEADQGNLPPTAVDHVSIPVDPTQALLRPFIGCPEDEMLLAWQAMVAVARAADRRAAQKGGE